MAWGGNAVVWMAAVAGLLLAEPALATNRLLDKARKAYENLDYGKAQTLLQKALKASSTSEEEVEIYFLLGTIHVIYGRDDQAKGAFGEVLTRNLAFVLPADTSPKIRAAFSDAQAAHAGRAADASPGPAGGEPPTRGPGTTEAEVQPPADPPPAPQTVVDPLALVSGGDSMMPTTRSYSRGPPFYRAWWFWTVVGVLAAGGGAYLTYVLVQPSYPRHDQGPFPIR